MSVRAKFKVDAIERTMSGKYVKSADGKNQVYVREEMRTVKMSPVYGNGDPNHENTKFWEATPSGQLTLGMINLAAAVQFELGDEFYVDFTVAPKPAS
jgi:hypothetical protein